MLGSGLTINLQIRKHWISVQAVPRHGETVQVEGMARMAVHHGKSGIEVLALGDEATAFANKPDVVLHDAFCHPRVLIGGFDAAALIVREFLQRSCGGKKPLMRFRLVITLLDELEGGLTDIEERALTELGMQIGASSVTICPKPVQQQAIAAEL